VPPSCDTPNASKQQQFRLRKAFYASLGVLQNTQAQPGVRQVWASPLGINIYLQPGIQLFDISAVKPGVLPDEKPQ